MKYITEKNKTYILTEEGKQIALLEHPEIKLGVVNLVHTEVDPTYAGQGIAGKLTEYVAEQLRKHETKAELSCSYSARWFEKHQEYADVLADLEEEKEKVKDTQGPACGIKIRK